MDEGEEDVKGESWDDRLPPVKVRCEDWGEDRKFSLMDIGLEVPVE